MTPKAEVVLEYQIMFPKSEANIKKEDNDARVIFQRKLLNIYAILVNVGQDCPAFTDEELT